MSATATTNPSKALVDRLTPEQLQAEQNELLTKLSRETNLNAKKKIRRALRARGYFLSRLTPATKPDVAEPIKGDVIEAPKPAEVKDDVSQISGNEGAKPPKAALDAAKSATKVKAKGKKKAK